MKLSVLLAGLANIDEELELSGLALDSRHVRQGDAFIALNGATQHGLAHVHQAIDNGAAAVIYDPAGCDVEHELAVDVTKVAVPGLGSHLSAIAAKFYAYPSRQLALIGITGTNGKTTCSQLIAQALPDCGVIGTLGWGEAGSLTFTGNTTPNALALQAMLRHFVQQRKSAVAMEVSSHGLQQGRVNAVEFQGAVFTNLSRDHLDYHGDMAAYLQAKLGLFANPHLKFAVVNLDDPASSAVTQILAGSVQCWSFSMNGKELAGAENIGAENIRYSSAGIHFDAIWGVKKAPAYTSLVGAFNLANILAVLAVLLAMDMPFSEAIARLAILRPIVGRMEKFGGEDKPTVFVDYAHTPDALEKVLKAAKSTGRLWVVFGCGGNRDKGKRAEMGRIAECWADRVVITDDNPRGEASAAIINDILAGCQSPDVTVINDRATAITTVIRQAAKQDIVMVAGKGHENYQEIDGIKMPFSDRDIVEQALADWGRE